MFWFSIVLVVVNIIFLSLGALLYIYASEKGIAIPERSDDLFPLLAVDHLPTFAGVIFLLGIIAAAYSSADSALTALTTSFCVDFLDFDKKEEHDKKSTRIKVHIGFSVLLFIVILIFNSISDASVISQVFTAAGYTYGPLLGLYAFGLFTKLDVKDNWVLPVCIAAPLLSYVLNTNSADWFNGLKFGFAILLVNGVLTFLGLLAISRRSKA